MRFLLTLFLLFASAAPAQPTVAFTVDAPIVEGLAAHGDRFFAGSVRTRQIYLRDEPFATLKWGVFGMAVDAKRNLVWAATSALPEMEGFDAADKDKAAVAKLDLRTGEVLATLQPDDAGPHLFGDVAVAPNGDVYASNSAAPSIYRVRGDRIELFVRGPFRSLQGVAVAGRTLYAADYSHGLFAIDLETRDIVKLPSPENTEVRGIDGLYAPVPNTLIATQNGTKEQRVLRLTLAPNGLRVTNIDVLAAGDPRMTDITLGAIRGRTFYFVANAGWGGRTGPAPVLRIGF